MYGGDNRSSAIQYTGEDRKTYRSIKVTIGKLTILRAERRSNAKYFVRVTTGPLNVVSEVHRAKAASPMVSTSG